MVTQPPKKKNPYSTTVVHVSTCQNENDHFKNNLFIFTHYTMDQDIVATPFFPPVQ